MWPVHRLEPQPRIQHPQGLAARPAATVFLTSSYPKEPVEGGTVPNGAGRSHPSTTVRQAATSQSPEKGRHVPIAARQDVHSTQRSHLVFVKFDQKPGKRPTYHPEVIVSWENLQIP